MINQATDIVLRSTVVYLAILIGLRLRGKSHVAQLSILDFVLVLLISNAVQNAMVGDDHSLEGGLIAAGTLVAVNYILSLLFFRFRRAETFLEGTPTLLIHNGEIIQKHLDAEKITTEELERAIREHGLENISQVKSAVMESDGTISVIPRAAQEKRIDTFKHRKVKFEERGTKG